MFENVNVRWVYHLSAPVLPTHAYVHTYNTLRPHTQPYSLHLQEKRSDGTDTSNEATDLDVARRAGELRDRGAVSSSARRRNSADLRSKGSADASTGGDNGRNGRAAASGVGSRRSDGERGRGGGGVDAVGESPEIVNICEVDGGDCPQGGEALTQ